MMTFNGTLISEINILLPAPQKGVDEENFEFFTQEEYEYTPKRVDGNICSLMSGLFLSPSHSSENQSQEYGGYIQCIRASDTLELTQIAGYLSIFIVNLEMDMASLAKDIEEFTERYYAKYMVDQYKSKTNGLVRLKKLVDAIIEQSSTWIGISYKDTTFVIDGEEYPIEWDLLLSGKNDGCTTDVYRPSISYNGCSVVWYVNTDIESGNIVCNTYDADVCVDDKYSTDAIDLANLECEKDYERIVFE